MSSVCSFPFVILFSAFDLNIVVGNQVKVINIK